jgi:hypothetical protein
MGSHRLSNMHFGLSRELAEPHRVCRSFAVNSPVVMNSMTSGTYSGLSLHRRCVGGSFVTLRHTDDCALSLVKPKGRHLRQVWRVEAAGSQTAKREREDVDEATSSDVKLGARPPRLSQERVQSQIMPVLSGAGGGLFFFWYALQSATG